MNNYLTIKQAAEKTGKSHKTIRRYKDEAVQTFKDNPTKLQYFLEQRHIGKNWHYVLNPDPLFERFGRVDILSRQDEEMTRQSPRQTDEMSTPSPRQNEDNVQPQGGNDSIALVIQALSDQLAAKDLQINKLIAGQEKTNLLVANLADRMALRLDGPKGGTVAKAETPSPSEEPRPNPVKKVEATIPPNPVPDPTPDPVPAPNPLVEESGGLNSTLASSDAQITDEDEMDIKQPEETSNPQQV